MMRASRKRRKMLVDDEESTGILLSKDPYKGEARDALIDALARTTTEDEREQAELYAKPLLTFFVGQFRLFDSSLLEALGDDTSTYSAHNPPSFAFICSFLTAVINGIRAEADPSLDTIRRQLEAKALVKKAVPANTVYQLVFTTFGLVTAFFKPSVTPTAGRLQLSQPERSGLRRAGTWQSNSEVIDDDIVHISLSDLLFRFSKGTQGPIPHPTKLGTVNQPLVSSNLNYYTLAELAGLSIEWIDSICEHLELDSRNKVLKLFRFPSLCMTLCVNASKHEDKTWLESLFSTTTAATVTTEVNNDDESSLKSSHFFREVIYSYAILFAQSNHSRSKFNSLEKKRQQQRSTTLLRHNYCQHHDPLLKRLYSKDWTTAFIDELGIGDVKLSYKPDTDFPFLGRRLQILQEYSVAQIPNTWKLLWKDRRDLNRFYTLWAALIFGILSLSMGLIQICLAIAQVVGTFNPPP